MSFVLPYGLVIPKKAREIFYHINVKDLTSQGGSHNVPADSDVQANETPQGLNLLPGLESKVVLIKSFDSS